MATKFDYLLSRLRLQDSSGGGGVPEAPVDGTGYVRKDGAWAAESMGTPYAEFKIADFTAEDAKAYVTGGSVIVTDPVTPAPGAFFQVMVGPDDATIGGDNYLAGANVLSIYDGVAWNRYDFAAGGGGVPEAPIDGNLYGRKDGAWATATIPQDMFLKSYEGPAVSGQFGKWVATRAGTLQHVTLQSGNQIPVGSNAVAELRKNGVNVLNATLQITTAQSPTNGDYVGTPVTSFTSASFVAGDVFTAVFPSAPGSTTPIVDPVMVVRALF